MADADALKKFWAGARGVKVVAPVAQPQAVEGAKVAPPQKQQKKMGRPLKGERPMTPYERTKAWRARKKEKSDE